MNVSIPAASGASLPKGYRPEMLAYNENTLGPNGTVLSREKKDEIRSCYGYCRKCQGVPVQLFMLRKPWLTKEARSAPGECKDGVCFVCYPHKDPNKNLGRRSTHLASDHSRKPPPSTQIIQSDHSANAGGSASGSNHEPRHPMAPTGIESSPPKVALSPSDPQSKNTILPRPSPPRTGKKPFDKVWKPGADNPMNAESLTPSIPGGSNESLEGLKSQHSESSSSSDLQTQSSGTSDSSYSTYKSSPPNGNKPIVIQEDLPPTPNAKAYSEIEMTNIIEGINALVQECTDYPESLAEFLMGALRQHSEIASIQTHGLSIIRDLCKDSPVNRSAMMSAGLSEDLVRTFESHIQDPVVLEHGFAIILSLGDDHASRIRLIRAGACTSIINAIKSFLATESLVQNAIVALRALSPESEAREIFGGIGASKLVSEAMRHHRSSVVIQRDGCAFLSNCAVNGEKQSVAVVPFEELDAIVQALVHHRQEPFVVQEACFALKNYTHQHYNCRTLRKCKGVEALFFDFPSKVDTSYMKDQMQLYRAIDESLEDEACSSLQRRMDSADVSLRTPRSILRFMENFDWSVRVTVFGLQILQQVGSAHLFSNDLHQQVISYCQTFSSNEDVCREACRFLIRAADSFWHQRLLVDAGACQILFNSLSVGRHDVTIAFNALKGLEVLLPVQGCSEKCLENMGLIKEVVALHKTHECIQELCISILFAVGRRRSLPSSFQQSIRWTP